MESSLKIRFIFLAVLMATTITTTALASEEENVSNNPYTLQNKESSFLQRTNRFLAQSRPPADKMTCDRYPRVCKTKGGPGPDCCKKQCVNVMTDSLNCGMCGKKCGYFEMCCRGECVNPSTDEKNCGRCNNKCGNGSSCVYGLCSYA